MNDDPAITSEASTAAALNLWDLILQGGWAMIPLLACSSAALLLLGLGWLDTRRGRFLPTAWQDLLAPLRELRLDDARQALAQPPTILGQSLTPALERFVSSPGERPLQTVEDAFGERLDAAEARYARRVLYLNVIASVAPMIGLLGTVSGMIGAFQTIGRGGMGRPEELAGDIGQALVTTAAGLVVGIPAMLGYFGLRHRLAARTAEVAHAAESLILALAEGAVARGSKPPTRRATPKRS